MQSEKNSLSKWLVKSENKILGPYTYEQIEELIQKKQISIIDEVKDSTSRWLYVRENPEFKKIVEAIRKELDSKLESTKTYQSVSKTEEFSKTKSDYNSPTDVELDVKDVSVVKEIIQNQYSDKRRPASNEQVKLYGLAEDQKIQEKVSLSWKTFLFSIISLFIFASFSLVGFYYYKKTTQQNQEESWAQQIKKYKFLGLEQKAIEVFEKLSVENQKKLLPNVIELLPRLEAQGLIQNSEIEDLKVTANLSLEQRSYIFLAQYWQAMQSQNYDLAQEFIIKASAVQPSSALVKENDAIVQLKKKKFQKALEIYLDLNKIDPSGRYLTGAATALINLPETARTPYIAQLSQYIEKYTYIFYDYKKELLLTQLWLSKIEKNDALFKITWSQFINTPCQLTTFFKKPLLLAQASYLWSDLGDYVKALKSQLTGEDLVLFETHNLLEQNQISLANQYITDNATKLKDNFLKQQLAMLVYHFQSRFADVLSLYKTKQIDMKSEMNQLIVGFNKLEENSAADLSEQMSFFKDKNLSFYSDWLTLAQLLKLKANDALKVFTRNHFLTVGNFKPALEAKSIVE